MIEPGARNQWKRFSERAWRLVGRDDARGLLARRTVETALLRVISAGLGFASALLLARLLGVAEYGRYALALSWASLLGLLGVAGLDRLLVRQVAACRVRAAWGDLHGLLRWAFGIGFSASLVAAGLGAIFAGAKLLSLGWFLVPLIALMRLPQAALRGLNFVAQGQIAELLMQPLVLLAGLLAVARLQSGWLEAAQALNVYAAAALVAVALAYGLLARALPPEVRASRPRYESQLWMRSALPLLLVAGLDIVNSQMDLLMLGAMADVRAVSLYAAADRGANLIAFPLMAANAALAPAFAGLHALGDRLGLQRLVTKSARAILMASSVLALAICLAAPWFLRLFGPGFLPARPVLLILCAGQWINAAAGSVATLLLMTGREREVALGMGAGLALNFALNLALIPRWGAEGAAVAVTISLAGWNVLLAWFVRRTLGIRPTALAFARED